MSLTLRHEAPADHRAVETLVREAFWNVYKPGCDEHYYLHLLRQSPAFRPEAGGRLDTVTFGPLAVLPSFQGKGLARALVCHALRQAQALGEQAVVILGDPRHYGRYGFWCGERWGIALENGQYLPASRRWNWYPAPWQTPPGASARALPMPPMWPRWTLLTPSSL